MSTKFAHFDSDKPDGVYVTSITMVTQVDDHADAPDDSDDGFWPSEDRSAAGYVEPEKFDEEMEKAERRMTGWRNGDWCFMGVMAKATVCVIKNGHGTSYEITSAGLWGVESDSDDEYVLSIFKEETEALVADIRTMAASGDGAVHIASDEYYQKG